LNGKLILYCSFNSYQFINTIKADNLNDALIQIFIQSACADSNAFSFVKSIISFL